MHAKGHHDFSFRVEGLLRLQGLHFLVQIRFKLRGLGLKFRVKGLGFRVYRGHAE